MYTIQLYCGKIHQAGFLDDKSTLDANSRVVKERVGGAF